MPLLDIDRAKAISRGVVALWLSVAVAHVATGEGADLDFDTLMAHLAASGTVRAHFVETRQISLLDGDLESRGTLFFAPGDATRAHRLARHTHWPGRSRVIVEGSRVSFWDETGIRVVDLGRDAVARGLLGNLIALLRGDGEGLRERYTLSFRAEGSSWTLDLVPRAKALRALVERIRVVGDGGIPASMETRETNGDRSLLTFSKIETQLELSADELARVFAPEPGGDAGDGPGRTSSR